MSAGAEEPRAESAEPYRGRRVLVTGASGFIGTRLVARLLRAGAVVSAISRDPPLRSGVRFLKADLADAERARALFRAVEPEVVLHLAGCPFGVRDTAHVPLTLSGNLLTTVNVLLAATEHGKPRVVTTGSLEEPSPGDAAPVISSPYAASKVAASIYGALFQQLFALPVVKLRVFMVYGPGQSDERKLVPYSILSYLRGAPPELTSGTRQIDWIYVDDVVDAYLLAGQRPGIDGATFEVGSGKLVSIREIVEHVRELTGSPLTPAYGAVADRPLEQVRVANVAESASGLGWRPEVELVEGLRRTVAWYRDGTDSA